MGDEVKDALHMENRVLGQDKMESVVLSLGL